jgi:CxxC motif-containing protein
MNSIIICTLCPNGCRIEIAAGGGQDVELAGYGCQRGRSFAEEECLAPKRILTASVQVSGAGRKMLPVRTTMPVPKDQLLACMEELGKISLDSPVAFHQVILHDILGTGADVVASMRLERNE